MSTTSQWSTPQPSTLRGSIILLSWLEIAASQWEDFFVALFRLLNKPSFQAELISVSVDHKWCLQVRLTKNQSFHQVLLEGTVSNASWHVGDRWNHSLFLEDSEWLNSLRKTWNRWMRLLNDAETSQVGEHREAWFSLNLFKVHLNTRVKTTWPRNFRKVLNKFLFFYFTERPALLILSRTAWTSAKCCS